MSFGRFLLNICGRLSQELNIVETSGLIHFVAPVALQMTYISDFKFRECKSVEGLTHMILLTFFGQSLLEIILRTNYRRDFWFESFCSSCCLPDELYFLFQILRTQEGRRPGKFVFLAVFKVNFAEDYLVN